MGAYCSDSYPLQVWVNGKELPSTGIELCSGNGNTVNYYDLSQFFDYFHHETENVIAVILENTWASSWDDISFDLRYQCATFFVTLKASCRLKIQ